MAEATALSRAGAKFIGAFEGFRSCTYRDPVGIPTIGFGTTDPRYAFYRNGKPNCITRELGLKLLRRDAKAPAAAARRAAIRQLKQHELDALTSFGYNLGAGIFDGSHTIGQALRKRRITRRRWKRKVAAAILLYDKAGGRTLAGLTRRRRAERRLWLTGSYSTA